MGDLLVLVIMAVALGGIGLYVSAPLLKERQAEKMLADFYQETELHHLLSRKESIYTAIKDLEFDYKTGKLADEDYEELKTKFEEQAAQVLQEIDSLKKGQKKTEPAGKAEGKGKRSGVKKGALRQEANAVCSACGAKLPSESKFCPACGEKVEPLV